MKCLVFIILLLNGCINAGSCNTYGYSNPKQKTIDDHGDQIDLIRIGLQATLSDTDIGTLNKKNNKYTFSNVYESEKDCPERCFDLCNFWANDIAQYDQTLIEKIKSRQCAGFTYRKLSEADYECEFVIGTSQHPPKCSERVIGLGLGNEDDEVYLRIPCEDATSSTPFPPPLPPSIPPPNVETLILQPKILIPLIIGTVFILILIIFLFRECTRERADSCNQVFRALLGRRSNRVVIDTNKKVESSQAIRK